MRRSSWQPRLALLGACFAATALLGAEPAAKGPPRELTADEIAVNKAIDRCVGYLKPVLAGSLKEERTVREGRAAQLVAAEPLMAWALLEAGVPKSDPVIQKTAELIRAQGGKYPALAWMANYQVSLAILFLDKLGEADDGGLIQTFALRLVQARLPGPGLRAECGWAYECPPIGAEEEKELRKLLVAKDKAGNASVKLPKARGRPYIFADNSNSQFALTALWVAQRHGLNLQPVLAEAAERLRRETHVDGGTKYSSNPQFPAKSTASMTCVGLLGRAIGHGLAKPKDASAPAKSLRDPAIDRAFHLLGQHLRKPSQDGFVGADGKINMYAAWSLSRTALIYDLKTIERLDWYAWAAKGILAVQRDDGGVPYRSGDSSDAVGTSFALLVLKRSHVAPELTTALRSRIDLRNVGQLNEPKSMWNRTEAESLLPKK